MSCAEIPFKFGFQGTLAEWMALTITPQVGHATAGYAGASSSSSLTDTGNPLRPFVTVALLKRARPA